ncbi:GDP-L-fucose synthase [Bacteriovoracaceae bacterium]|nr:GDP-L-fucose synthase [Bacteriovoracaceae bacterium]
MILSDKVLVLGATGLLGQALIKELAAQNFSNVLCPGHDELELLDQTQTIEYFKKNSPDVVILAAAKVGGISANMNYGADFILENLRIQQNCFGAALKVDVKKFLFIGSSCIYPKNCPQPIKEEYLLTSELEITNEPFAIAKIAGLKMAESIRNQYGKNYFTVMPTSMYGINDNFDSENGHVIPSLISRFHEIIKSNEQDFYVWGTGKAKREFLYVDDMAKACLYLLSSSKSLPPYINAGYGEDISIGELAVMIAKKMNFKGNILFDQTRPDGTMRKILDSSKIFEMGWSPKTSLSDGLDLVIESYLKKNH